jgi:hypothetical protein
MPKFHLADHITVSAYTVVEAETIEDAIKTAEGRLAVIGGPGSGYEDDEHWIIEEADGEVENIHDANAS